MAHSNSETRSFLAVTQSKFLQLFITVGDKLTLMILAEDFLEEMPGNSKIYYKKVSLDHQEKITKSQQLCKR